MLDAELRPVPAGTDSALLAALIAVAVVGLFCAPTLRRLLGDLLKRLLRKRADSQTGELTLGERMMVGIGLLQTLVFEALTLYCLAGAAARPPLAALAGLIVLAAAVMAVQAAGYRAVGFAFAPTADDSRSWLFTFALSQVACGYLLVIPAFGALLYPALAPWFIGLAGIAYLGCRILLFIREFGIFYTNLGSLFYFFLYLCTLEIVPLLLAWVMATRFSALFC